jgi:hypothetical protein
MNKSFDLLNYHCKFLKLDDGQYYDYFRIRICKSTSDYSWMIFSNLSVTPMMMLPTSLNNVFIFLMDANEFLNQGAKNIDLFIFLRKFLLNFKSKKSIKEEIWVP